MPDGNLPASLCTRIIRALRSIQADHPEICSTPILLPVPFSAPLPTSPDHRRHPPPIMTILLSSVACHGHLRSHPFTTLAAAHGSHGLTTAPRSLLGQLVCPHCPKWMRLCLGRYPCRAGKPCPSARSLNPTQTSPPPQPITGPRNSQLARISSSASPLPTTLVRSCPGLVRPLVFLSTPRPSSSPSRSSLWIFPKKSRLSYLHLLPLSSILRS